MSPLNLEIYRGATKIESKTLYNQDEAPSDERFSHRMDFNDNLSLVIWSDGDDFWTIEERDTRDIVNFDEHPLSSVDVSDYMLEALFYLHTKSEHKVRLKYISTAFSPELSKTDPNTIKRKEE